MSVLAEPNRRLDADERRAQLVEAGLGLLESAPFDKIGAAEVARAAAVSKGLVFHYFPTTADLHVAVARAAAERLVGSLVTDPELPQERRLALGLEAFIAYIERAPAAYLAVSRGAGRNEGLLAVYEDARRAIVQLMVEALGYDDPPPALRIMLRGWNAMVEEAVLHWLADRPIPRERLVDLLKQAALDCVSAALAAEAAAA